MLYAAALVASLCAAVAAFGCVCWVVTIFTAHAEPAARRALGHAGAMSFVTVVWALVAHVLWIAVL